MRPPGGRAGSARPVAPLTSAFSLPIDPARDAVVPLPDLRRRADIVLGPAKVAMFVGRMLLARLPRAQPGSQQSPGVRSAERLLIGRVIGGGCWGVC